MFFLASPVDGVPSLDTASQTFFHLFFLSRPRTDMGSWFPSAQAREQNASPASFPLLVSLTPTSQKEGLARATLLLFRKQEGAWPGIHLLPAIIPPLRTNSRDACALFAARRSSLFFFVSRFVPNGRTPACPLLLRPPAGDVAALGGDGSSSRGTGSRVGLNGLHWRASRWRVC